MKRFFEYLMGIAVAVSLLACSPQEKVSIINLSTENLTFQSLSGQQKVFSRGQGFELDAIVMDGEIVSDRIDRNGDLLLDAGWINVFTPGAASGQVAKQMIVAVRGNNTGSDRECEILVHNGKVREKVTVIQKKEAVEEKK